MKRAGLYVRVSTEEQKINGISIDSQIEALTEYCDKHGYEIAGVYNDAGISARKRYTKRPALLSLIEDCRSGRVDIILFTLLDRWFRSVADYHEVQTILDDCGVPWRAIWEDYETETSSGILKVNIMLSVAQADADRTSEKIRAVMAYKRAHGEYVGTAPPGYMVDEDMKLVKDPKTEEAVRAIFDGYTSYKSIKEISEDARALGFIATRSKINRIVSNPVYLGTTRSGIEGIEPYITEEDWNIIQKRKKRYTRSTKKKHVFLFNGLVRCGICGNTYVCRSPAAPRRHCSTLTCNGRYNAFNCNSIGISERKLERYLLARIEDIFEKEKAKYTLSIQAKKSKSAAAEKKKLTEKLGRIIELYEDGDISRAEFLEKRNAINAKIAGLREEPRKDPPELPENWREAYEEMSKRGKSEFWHSIIDTVIFDSINRDHIVKLRGF